MLGASFLGTLFLFITWFHPAFSLNEVFFFSIVFSILSSSWIGFIVQGFWYNEFNEQGIIISNAFFTVLVLLYAKSAYKKIKMSIENFRFITAASTNAAYMSGKGSNSPYAEMFREYVRNGNGLMFHIFALLCFTMFYILFDHHSLSIGEDGASYSGGGCWGDIAFHLDIISSFLYGPNMHFKPWALSNPIYSGTTLQYTLLPDYHSAMLIKGGFSVRHAFFGPGVLMSWSICCLLYFYTFRFTEGSKGTLRGRLSQIFVTPALSPFRFHYRLGVALTRLWGAVRCLQLPAGWPWLSSASPAAWASSRGSTSTA